MEKNFQIYMELEDVSPKIWRRFVVPSAITLDRLSDVVQIVMGWTGEHMHSFNIKGKNYMDLPEDEKNTCEEGLFRLNSLVPKKGDEFTYLYDFGDSWIHFLKIEKVNPDEDEEWGSLFCLDGKGQCPPEDVGGPPGFQEFKRAMSNSKDPEHEHYLEWFGGVFDPEGFDPIEANLSLLFFLRWSRDRFLPWFEETD